VAKLIIDPQKLLEIRAAVDALDQPKPPIELPAEVAAFWNAEESTIPPWRLETSAERAEREALESLGVWTG
jgi:hypothetical protein